MKQRMKLMLEDQGSDTGPQSAAVAVASAAVSPAPAPTAAPSTVPPSFAGAITGRIVAVRDAAYHVTCAGGKPMRARSTLPLALEHVGREVVLLFEGQDAGRPIIVGLLAPERGCSPAVEASIEAEGERLVVTAPKQVVLRCGSASITLTSSGKVLIHGEYVSSRATGTHRIRGGSILLN